MNDEVKHHPAIDAPWTWEIVELTYQRIDSVPSLDLTFKKDTRSLKLRFLNPHGLSIEENFTNPGNPSDIYIADISGRGWDGVTIEVGHFEQTGTIRFYASEIVTLK